jgi:tRNA(fMet)-specific endonuclease VapC
VILLETDHLSVLKYSGSERCTRLTARLAMVTNEVIGTTIITVEEQMRGWMASISKERQVRRQIGPYRELMSLFEFFSQYEILPFDDSAATIYEGFGRIRIGSMDRKIAAIAIANKALLLTANRRDYERVPGLRFENWMD